MSNYVKKNLRNNLVIRTEMLNYLIITYKLHNLVYLVESELISAWTREELACLQVFVYII